jgi:hypothetical protein
MRHSRLVRILQHGAARDAALERTEQSLAHLIELRTLAAPSFAARLAVARLSEVPSFAARLAPPGVAAAQFAVRMAVVARLIAALSAAARLAVSGVAAAK